METQPTSAREKELRFLAAYYQLIMRTANLSEDWRQLYKERFDELIEELNAFVV